MVVPAFGIDTTGDFKPLVEEALFEKVQAILTGRKPGKSARLTRHPDFPLRRFVVCASCGSKFTGSWSRGRKGRYAYYRCSNSKCGQSVPKDRLESLFAARLETLKPPPGYVELFRRVVLDVWRARGAAAEKIQAQLRQRLEDLKHRKTVLLDAHLYKRTIDAETYEEERDRLAGEIASVRLDLHDAELEELDVEGVLGFAEHVITNARRLWQGCNLEQKQRLQWALFPEGLPFDGKSFGTAPTNLLSRSYQVLQGGQESVASPT